MTIEIISPHTVSVNGRTVEVRAPRMPEHLANVAPVEDKVDDLLTGHFPLIDIDHKYEAVQRIPEFLELARRAADERAESYRGFLVGASAYALDTKGHRVGYLFGANSKPSQDAPKHCAEMDVLAKARKQGFDSILAIATFGPSDFGDVNAVQTPTLHPCAECRALIATDPMIADDTLIVTSNENGEFEMMFRQDLIALHETGS